MQEVKLDEFRDDMLHDLKIKIIHDFPNSSICFPGVEIKGGVCYFLWDNEYSGECEVITHKIDNTLSKTIRPLLEKNVNTLLGIMKQSQYFINVLITTFRLYIALVVVNLLAYPLILHPIKRKNS